MKQTSLNRIATFSRWSRTNYGVFASLGRQVRIGVLSTSMAIVAFDAMAIQADTTRFVTIEAISVITERGGAAAGALDVARVALDPLTITFAPNSSTESALRKLPFIDVRQRGARGVQADISLRGASADQTTIMLNGVSFSDARTGHQSHSLPISMANIENIKYLSHQIAVGSFSGALDYATPSQSKNFLDGYTSGGSYGTFNVGGAGAYNPAPGLTLYGAASYEHSDGYIENTDYSRLNLYARAQYASSQVGNIDFQIGYQDMNFGSNGFYSLAYPMQWEATRTALSSFKYSKSWGRWQLEAMASYRFNSDRFELYRPYVTTPPESYKGGNYHITDNVGLEARVTRNWGAAGRTSIGLDFTYNNIISTTLGDKLDNPKRVAGIDYGYGKERAQASHYIRHNVFLGKFDIAAAASLAQTPYGIAPLGGITAAYNPTKGLRLELAAWHTMRMPTFTDLYYTTPTHIGNKDLIPEKATTIGLTTSYAYKAWSASAAVYYRWGDDIIDWVRQQGEERWQAMQITSLATIGVELQAQYAPRQGFIQSIEASYGYISSNKSSGDYLSKYALDYMKHKASIAGQLRLHKKLILAITATYYDRNGQYQEQGPELREFKPYFLLDSRLTWQWWRLRLWGECSNILDQKYFDFGGIIQPGRWFMAGVTVKMH